MGPTHRKTTPPHRTKSTVETQRNAMDANKNGVNSKLLRIREEDLNEADQRSEGGIPPSEHSEKQPPVNLNNSSKGDPPKHNFEKGETEQRVDKVNNQIQKMVEKERDANGTVDWVKLKKEKEKEQPKEDDTSVSKRKNNSDEEK